MFTHKHYVLLAALFSLWTTHLLKGDEQSTAADGIRKTPLLSVRQTIAAACLRPDKPPYAVFRAANPKARPALHSILNEESQTVFHSNCIWMLGFIGDEKDLSLLEAYLKQASRRSLDKDGSNAVLTVPNAIALMARRGVKGSEDKLEQMLDRSYWEKMSFESFSKLPANVPSASWQLTSYSLYATTYVGAEYAQASYDKCISFESDPKVREFHAKRFPKEVLKDVAADLETKLTGRISEAQVSRLMSESIPDDITSLLDLEDSKTQADDQLPMGETPSKRDSKDITPQEIAEYTKEAQEAFEHFRTALKKEEYEKIVDSLLNDSLFMNEENLKRYRQHMLEQALPKVARGMDEAKIDDIKPADVAVRVEEGAGGKKIIVVRWRLPGTADIGKRLAGNKRGDPETIDPETSELLVLLKKKDGKWYWNPFNW